MILNEATVVAKHHCLQQKATSWFQNFWGTGANWPYLREPVRRRFAQAPKLKAKSCTIAGFWGNSPNNMKGFLFPMDWCKIPKKTPSPLKCPQDFKIWGTWREDLWSETKYRFRPKEGGVKE